jgi:hypothetical protein
VVAAQDGQPVAEDQDLDLLAPVDRQQSTINLRRRCSARWTNDQTIRASNRTTARDGAP